MSMKKRIILMAVAVIMAVSAVGCAASNYKNEDRSPAGMVVNAGPAHSDVDGVTIGIVDILHDGDETKLEVQWRNDTQHNATYGASFVIERQVGGEWVDCVRGEEPYFIELGYVLPAGKAQTETYNVTKFFDISQPGNYRFRTECFVYPEEETSKKCVLWAEFTVEEDASQDPVKLEHKVQYIRTDGYRDGAKFPVVRLIRSLEELNDYYKDNKETFWLERNPDPASDATIGFLDACDRYDEAFFESSYLVFVLLEEGSGSVRHEVTKVEQCSGQIAVNIDSIVPEIGTCDMAEWHVILELNKTAEVGTESDVMVYLDGRLAAGTVKEATQSIGIPEDTPTAAPAAKLVYGGDSTPAFPGSFYWEYIGEDAEDRAICADGPHPLDCRESLTPIRLSDGTALLAFEEDPDSVTVTCWPDSAWGNTDAAGEAVELDGFEIQLKPGGYIYSVTARWGGQNGTGSASYYFYVIYDEDPDQPPVEEPPSGYCGNTVTTVYADGKACTFMGDESVTLTDILANLAYDKNKLCKCLPEYTVDTEFGKGYGISLSAGYARCEKGQAELTQEQIDTIGKIIGWAKDDAPAKDTP